MISDIAIPTFKYVGQVNDTTKSMLGDVGIIDDKFCLYTGNEWIEIEEVSTTDEKEKPKKILPKVCSQCGAPVKSYRSSCEYCGVSYT